MNISMWSPEEQETFQTVGALIHGNVLHQVYPELTEYTIPSNIRVIGRDAFKNSKVREVTIPEGVSKLDICAFCNSALERVTLPESLKIVGAYAFANCKNLTELTIPKYVSQIDDDAFEGLENCVLTILNECDDEEVFRLSPDAFGRRNPCIKEIRVPFGSVAMRYGMKRGLNVTIFPCTPQRIGNYKKYRYIGENFCCDGSKLHEYFGRSAEVHIPRGISTIGDNAFSDSAVRKVYLPKTVHWIEEFGFAGCSKLTEIVGEGLRGVEENAFYGCENLKTMYFPKLEQYMDNSFSGCAALLQENMHFAPNTLEIPTRCEMCDCENRNIKIW